MCLRNTSHKQRINDRINISEGIDVNKTNASKECDICHYWYFKDIGFKYEPYLCNGCHDLMQKAMSFNNVAIVYVKGSAYRIHFWYMSKNDAINIMNNSNFIDKKGALYFFLSIYRKLSASLSDSSDELFSKSSSLRFSVFMFCGSYLHSSKGVWG